MGFSQDLTSGKIKSGQASYAVKPTGGGTIGSWLNDVSNVGNGGQAQKSDTPRNTSGGGGGGGGGGGDTGGGYDPYVAAQQAQAQQDAQQKADALAFLENQQQIINQQINRLGGTQDTGLSNISNSYNRSYNRLDQQKAVAERDYNTGTQDTIKGYQSSRNQVATNVRSRMNALQRLLGLAGSGNSSASFDAVPYAATLQGSQQIAPVQATYGVNRRNLDTNWEDTLRNYGNSVEDLKAQKFQQTQALKASIAQARADLLDKLSTLGVQINQANGGNAQQALDSQASTRNQINRLLDSIAGLGKQYAKPVIRTADLKYLTPDLGKYNLGPQGEITTDAPGADNIDPTFLPVLEDDREEELLSGLAG